jgi:hypothetical protein
MATINTLKKGGQFGQTPYGNQSTYRFALATNASGAPLDTDSTAALAVGDKVILGKLPAGLIPTDSTVIVSAAFTASTTASLGFEYADGVDDPDSPQDSAYFGTGLALSAAGRLRNATTKALKRLTKEALLTLTWAGAANAKAGALEVVIDGESVGNL